MPLNFKSETSHKSYGLNTNKMSSREKQVSATILQLVNILPTLLQHRLSFESKYQRLQVAMTGRDVYEKNILKIQQKQSN